MKTRTIHKALSMLLTAAMVLNMGLTPVFATEGTTPSGVSGVCTHHTEHKVNGSEADREGPLGGTEDCGYTPDSHCTFDPASCTECKPGNQPIEKVCTCEPVDSGEQIHGKDCPLYTAPECTCPPVDGGELVHGKDCPLYTAPALSKAVQELIAMVDALPNPEDITEDNNEATLLSFEAAVEAYGALSDEDKAAFETTEQYKKLMALHGVLFAMMPMAAGDKVALIRNGSVVATYADLNKAMAKESQIQTGDTVKLLDNVRTTAGLFIENDFITNITFDLNNKTVTVGYNTFGDLIAI